MSFSATGKMFKLPNKIAHLIHERNKNSTIKILETGVWIVEGPTLFVYKYWFNDLFPDAWGEAMYQCVFNNSWGAYMKKYENMFIVSDTPFTNVSFPIQQDLSSFIDEIANKFHMHPIEVLHGLLNQVKDSLLK
jgi:hypothetical protein